MILIYSCQLSISYIQDDSPLASDEESVAGDDVTSKEAADDPEKPEKSHNAEGEPRKVIKIPVSNHVKMNRGAEDHVKESSPDTKKDNRTVCVLDFGI